MDLGIILGLISILISVYGYYFPYQKFERVEINDFVCGWAKPIQTTNKKSLWTDNVCRFLEIELINKGCDVHIHEIYLIMHGQQLCSISNGKSVGATFLSQHLEKYSKNIDHLMMKGEKVSYVIDLIPQRCKVLQPKLDRVFKEGDLKSLAWKKVGFTGGSLSWYIDSEYPCWIIKTASGNLHYRYLTFDEIAKILDVIDVTNNNKRSRHYYYDLPIKIKFLPPKLYIMSHKLKWYFKDKFYNEPQKEPCLLL